jgi:hypothetical protein
VGSLKRCADGLAIESATSRVEVLARREDGESHPL